MGRVKSCELISRILHLSYHTLLKSTCSCSLFYLLYFLSHAISKHRKKKERKEHHHVIIFYLKDVSVPQENILYFQFKLKFDSVFNRCTNCLANSVLYSCEHTQGFILYCISTHWTIIWSI